MKKLLLSASLLVISAGVFAQTARKPEAAAPYKKTTLTLKQAPVVRNTNAEAAKGSALGKKATVSDWYFPKDFIDASGVGAALDRSITFVSADSNFKTVREDGSIDHVVFQSYGQVLDPKDDLILSTDNIGIHLSQFNSYSLDSILLQYCYIRNVDTFDLNMDGVSEEVIDTVFIAYYANAQVQRATLNNTAQDKVSLVDWNSTSRMPTNCVKIDTVLLGSDRSNSPFDTTSVSSGETLFGSKFATFKAPAITVNANSLVGFTATFKSGVPAVIGNDTAVIIWQGATPPPSGTRRANTFGTLYFFNPSTSGVTYENPTYYNAAQFMPSWNAYGQNSNWVGNYIPGLAFTADLFLQTGFHCTSTNVGMKETDLISISSIFPNPASNSATVNFNLKKSGNVSIKVINIVGQEVANVEAGNLVAGNNSISLDVNTFKPGVYFVNVTVDGVSTTQKLTVSK